MKPKNKEYLLKLARRTIEKFLTDKEIIVLNEDDLDSELKEHKGVFVTLKKNDELRGCIGEMTSQKPIYQSVIDNSLASAFLDPRFPPLEKEELDEITIEISVLSPLKIMKKFEIQEEFLSYLEKFKPGILLIYRQHQATFLPDVWEELKKPEDFLSHLCLKAGLEPDFWEKNEIYKQNSSEIKILEYQTESFSEESIER